MYNNYYYNGTNKLKLLKGYYPHDLINIIDLLNTISYKGPVPDIKYFNNISLENYNSI
jgi:hypothetical protein